MRNFTFMIWMLFLMFLDGPINSITGYQIKDSDGFVNTIYLILLVTISILLYEPKDCKCNKLD